MPIFVKFIEKFLCSYARALGTQKKLGQTVVFNRFVPRVQKFLTDFNGGGHFERGAQRTNHAPFPFTCEKADFGGWGASGFRFFGLFRFQETAFFLFFGFQETAFFLIFFMVVPFNGGTFLLLRWFLV